MIRPEMRKLLPQFRWSLEPQPDETKESVAIISYYIFVGCRFRGLKVGSEACLRVNPPHPFLTPARLGSGLGADHWQLGLSKLPMMLMILVFSILSVEHYLHAQINGPNGAGSPEDMMVRLSSGCYLVEVGTTSFSRLQRHLHHVHDD